MFCVSKRNANSNMLSLWCFCVLVLCSCCRDSTAWSYECDAKQSCKHIICDPKEASKESEGKFVAHVPLTYKIRRTWVESHNKERNTKAEGSKAGCLRNLLWDDELAYIARVHTSLCPKSESKCVYTKRFPTASMLTFTKKGDATDKILTVIDEAMKVFLAKEELLTNDQSAFVGCSIGYCKECPEAHCYIATCMYDTDGTVKAACEAGADSAAAKCDQWGTSKGSKYEHLCRNTGKVFKTEKPAEAAAASRLSSEH